MARSAKPSNPANVLHRLVSRADAREALAWFVLVALAFPPWRAFEVEGSAAGWELEAFPYAVLAGVVLVAIAMLVGAIRPQRKTAE